MDFVKSQKIQAIKKAKKHQRLDNLLLYSLTALTSSLLCSSPFWLPSLSSSIKVLIFVSLPNISSIFLSSKFLFVIGNLIVLVLIGQSKLFSSDSPPPSDVYYNEYINRKKSLRNSSTREDKKERTVETTFKENVRKIFEDGKNKEGKGWSEGKTKYKKEREDSDGEDELSLPTEELNKRAGDFIARVNKQRRLEAQIFFSSGNKWKGNGNGNTGL